MEPVLEIVDLHKRYGRVKAVQGLSLTVEKGQVFGLLGPNGSGKTTTLGIVLNVVTKGSGSYRWFGQPPSKSSRKKIGAILETPIFYPYLSATDNLKITSKIKGADEKNIVPVLEKVGLLERKDDPFKTYSLGMKQRMAIAAALLADPGVLILDEPTNGLDPQGIVEIRELIIQIAQEGKTIVLASHLLDEVQRVCSHFAVLKNGKKMYTGRVDEALGAGQMLEVKAADTEKLIAAARELSWVQEAKADNGSVLVSLAPDHTSSDLNGALMEKGVILSHLGQRKKSLEKQFLEILASGDE